MEETMSKTRSLVVASVVIGSFALGTQAMALNPQPLPPRSAPTGINKSHSDPQIMMRKAGGDPGTYKVQRSLNLRR